MYQVLKYINDHFMEILSGKEVADIFGYSVAYFSEKFKAFTGCTFHSFINRRRMQYAAKCLRDDQKITDIAFDLGFSSINGFKKAFKNEFGVFPTQYKKQEKGYAGFSKSSLPWRCKYLIENINNAKCRSKYRGQHLYHFMKGYYSVNKDDRSPSKLVTASLCSVLDNFTPYIEPYELIVGYNYDDESKEINGYSGKNREEYNSLKKYLEAGQLRREQIDEILEHLTDKDDPYCPNYMYYDVHPAVPQFSKAESDMFCDRAISGGYKTNNHCIPDFRMILEKGFGGIIPELEHRYEESKETFYLNLLRICRSCSRIGHKYADCAAALAEKAVDPEERKRLEEIERVCRKVPEKPAETFREALQSIFFVHIVNTWEDGINANSLGRLDQILFPYYLRDIALGNLTKDEAYELICCLWIKLYKTYDVQNITIGGCDKNGYDAVNELSYMFLDAMDNCGLVRCLSVRYSSMTNRTFMRRCFETLKNGQPTFCNDDILIPALAGKDILWEDAADYALLGCIEPTIPGRSNSHSSTVCINLVKVIEYTLGQGKSIMHPEFGDSVVTKDPCQFKSFKQFLDAAYIHLETMIRATCNIVYNFYRRTVSVASLPFKTLLTDNCLDSRKDYVCDGARYNYFQIMMSGFANFIDSLEAIRTIIFREKRYTMKQLTEFITGDFPDEKARNIFMTQAAKYGNGILKTDELAREVYERICKMITNQENSTKLKFHPQFFSYSSNIQLGKFTAATPDGRHKGDILSYGVTPMSGCDINGYKAVLHSAAKLPAAMAAGNTSLIVDLSSHILTGYNLNKILNLFLDESKNGLCSTVFNIIDPEQLRRNVNSPKKEAEIYVNISGYSDNFCNLPYEIRREISKRTNHESV